MATDNLQLSTNIGTGDVLRSLFDSSGNEWVAGLCAYPTTIGSPAASTMVFVDLTHGLPVQPQTGSTFTVTGAGGTFPVTDSGGSLTVDGTVAFSNTTIAVTNAGTFLVQAAQSGTWNIGTVTTLTSITNPVSVINAGTFAVQAAQVGTWQVQQSGVWDVGITGGAVSVSGTVDVTGSAVTISSGTVTVTATNLSTNIAQVNGATVATGHGTAAGSLRVELPTDGTGVIAGVTTVTTLTTCSTVTTLANGQTSHDSVSTGSPLRIGAKAETSTSSLTLVADGDATDLFAGVDGVLITRPHTNLEGIVSGQATNTDGTSTQCIAAQAAGIKTYLTTIILCNSNTATSGTVDIKDGTTIKMSIPVPANGGAVVNLPVPLPGSAATAWNFDPSAAITTITCSMIGFTSKV